MEQQFHPIQYSSNARKRTNRQFLLVVVLPMVLLFVVAAVLTVLAGSRSEAVGGRAVWSHIATIFLILPTLLFMLIMLALLGGLSFGMIWIMRKLPPLFYRLYHLLIRVCQIVERIGQRVANVLIAAHARAVWLSRFLQSLRAPRISARKTGSARP